MTHNGRYYTVLGVDQSATLEEIKRAYRDLALAWHPDRFAHAPHLRDAAEERMREINEAYAALHSEYSNKQPATSAPTYGPASPDEGIRKRDRNDATEFSRRSGFSTVVPERSWQGPRHPKGVALSPDGRTAWAGGDGLRSWNTTSGSENGDFHVDRGQVTGLCASPCGRFMLYGYTVALFAAAERREVRLCDAVSGRERLRYKGMRDKLTAAAFSTDGDVVATGDETGWVSLWESGTGHQLHHISATDGPGAVRSVAVCDGHRRMMVLRVGAVLEEISLWDTQRGKLIAELTTHVRDSRRYGQIQDAAPSSDGRFLVVANNDPLRHAYTLHIWDVNTDRELRATETHHHRITHVVFAANGKWVLSSSEDRTAGLWDVSTGRQLCRFEGGAGALTSVSLSADCNTVLASSPDGTVHFWRVPLSLHRHLSA